MLACGKNFKNHEYLKYELETKLSYLNKEIIWRKGEK